MSGVTVQMSRVTVQMSGVTVQERSHRLRICQDNQDNFRLSKNGQFCSRNVRKSLVTFTILAKSSSKFYFTLEFSIGLTIDLTNLSRLDHVNKHFACVMCSVKSSMKLKTFLFKHTS